MFESSTFEHSDERPAGSRRQGRNLQNPQSSTFELCAPRSTSKSHPTNRRPTSTSPSSLRPRDSPSPRSNRRRSANPNAPPTDRSGAVADDAASTPSPHPRPPRPIPGHHPHGPTPLTRPSPHNTRAIPSGTPAHARPDYNTKPRTSHLSDADATVVARYDFTS
jgi:hypothetical protein